MTASDPVGDGEIFTRVHRDPGVRGRRHEHDDESRRGGSHRHQTRRAPSLRTVATVVAVLTFTWAAPVHAREPGTRFRARSKGAPVTTIFGGWSRSDDPRHVELEVAGGHVIGAVTRFRAGWLTPWTGRGRQPRFQQVFTTSAMNLVGDDIRLVERFRWRARGRAWSGWMVRSAPFKAGEFAGWTGAGFFRGFKRRSMQFEWEVRGSFRAPAEFEGSWVLDIN